MSRTQPVVVIYDRAASSTAQSRVAVHLRLRACGEMAIAQEWRIGGWYMDTGEDALSDFTRPALDRAVLALQQLPREVPKYLLVHDWGRLSHSHAVQRVIGRRVELVYGEVCTVAGLPNERARHGRAQDLAVRS